MNNARSAATVALLLACSLASAQPLRPLANGDSVIGVGLVHSQAPGAPVTFTPMPVEYTLTVTTDSAGTRTYIRRGESTPYWVYDRDFTRLVFRGLEVAADERFRLLPPGGKLAAGMAWEVDAHKVNLQSCGDSMLRYRAVSEKGPDVILRIDGREEKVATIRVKYESGVKCEGREPFLRTHELIYSPALHEIVQSVSTNYDGPSVGAMQLGTQGFGWRLLGVTRAR